jgi:hypothetical protein
MTLQHDGIDHDDLWQAIEVSYDKNRTDGLPVVPRTERFVARMLAAGRGPKTRCCFRGRSQRQCYGLQSGSQRRHGGMPAGVLSVVGAALRALGDPTFELHGPATSTEARPSWSS